MIYIVTNSINVGSILPTTKNADFIFPPSRKNSVIKITKEDILNKALIKRIIVPSPNYIQDVNLVICIWTDKADSIDTELYSLIVHQSERNEENIEIIEVNNDQKMLCQPTKISDSQYRCLFMVVYDNNDVELDSSLLAHISSVNPNVLYNIFANFIEKEIYDNYYKSELKYLIPIDETAKYNNKINDLNYSLKTIFKNLR